MFTLTASRPASLIAVAAGTLFTLMPIFGQDGTRPPGGAAAKAAVLREAPGEELLPIRRITLYRSGVGSFERRGLIDGDASVQLRFDSKDINDILKSMIVLDLSGQGRIDGIAYSSKEPLSRRLASFGVNIADEPTLFNLLGRLRGAKVSFDVADAKVVGTILGSEARPEAMGQSTTPINVPYINVLTDVGIQSVKLTTIRSVRLQDQKLNDELNKALAAVAEYREDRTKTVDIKLIGGASREVVVGYVQESPVWKTSYRLVLPDGKKSDAKVSATPDSFTLQGWAHVENTTDEDWKGVTLGLVSGRPVSFRMDLYEPLYVGRPEIPVPTVPGVMPRTFAAGLSGKDADAKPGDSMGDVATTGVSSRARKLEMPGGSGRFDAGRAGSSARAEPSAAPAISSEDMAGYAAASQANAVEAGEVFQFEIDHPVTLERQKSAMLPILSAGVQGRRVSIFNASDGAEHPMRGLEITNSTNVQLMPGPITVFDAGTYAGDATIGHVPAGDKRLLAYSVDLDVDHETKQDMTEAVRKVRIVNGLFDLAVLRRSTISHSFTNKDQARGRTVIVEQPKLQNWELKEPSKPSETTAGGSMYRFEVSADAGKSATLKIVQEVVDHRSLGISQIDMPTLMQYSTQGEVSKAVLDAFTKASQLRTKATEIERKIAQLKGESDTISTDQARIRSNMSSIDKNSDLYRRYMTKLTEQESRLEALMLESAKFNEELSAARKAYDDFVATLTVE
jgi:hypothetical protein